MLPSRELQGGGMQQEQGYGMGRRREERPYGRVMPDGISARYQGRRMLVRI